ncbi:DNA-directed RNA polymerase subunit beta [Bacillus sp. CGMCC 1.16607]|uniref:DNA-directed RNA polymerase subunit beta n=1 Tax=Bacillus sp. CGMCC 1.16607 TaxID=3351842 RepID=UPI00363B6831
MTLDRKQVKTREEMRKIRAEEKGNLTLRELRERRKNIRVRLIPVWVKVIMVVLLLFVSVIAGTVVGYGFIGNGKPSEALQKETWTHILDMINKN